MAKKGDTPCGLRCLEGQGCSPLIEAREEILAFVAKATKGMEDHSEISELVWNNTTKQIAELIINTKECFDNMNSAALRLNDGAHVMENLQKDTDAVAELARGIKTSLEEALKESNTTLVKEIEAVADTAADELEDHEKGETGAHAILKHQTTWHRRVLYVFAGAFFTLGGWSLLLTIFILKTHPEFIDMIWTWVK